MTIDFLIVAGALSFVASASHIGIILGGPSWYRFFGAGEAMANMAEQKLLRPTLITLAIALVLACWGFYAWSGAGLIIKLPLVKLALIGITGIYLLRGVGGLIAPFVSHHPQISQNSTRFWLWSSSICIAFAVIHLKGLVDHWSTL